jgi:hypothetical protein
MGLDSIIPDFLHPMKVDRKSPLERTEKIGNHKGVVDKIHPSTLVLAKQRHDEDFAVHRGP